MLPLQFTVRKKKNLEGKSRVIVCVGDTVELGAADDELRTIVDNLGLRGGGRVRSLCVRAKGERGMSR